MRSALIAIGVLGALLLLALNICAINKPDLDASREDYGRLTRDAGAM